MGGWINRSGTIKWFKRVSCCSYKWKHSYQSIVTVECMRERERESKLERFVVSTYCAAHQTLIFAHNWALFDRECVFVSDLLWFIYNSSSTRTSKNYRNHHVHFGLWNFVCVSQSVRPLLYPNLCTQEEQKSIYLKLPQSCVKCFLVGDAMLNFWAIVRYRHRLADQSKSRLNRTQPCFGELTAAPSLNVMVFVKLSQRNELITNSDLDTDSYSSG